MPFNEATIMSNREEFVKLAEAPRANIRELCRRFNISPTTGYKWLDRYQVAQRSGLQERSRKPLHSPEQTPASMEARVLALRQKHPAWGARKLKRRLADLGITGLPSASTVHAILVRNGCIAPEEGEKHQAWHRFEHAAPNDLWQMDFKGHVPMGTSRCHPLTVLDDHSRFALCLDALPAEDTPSVQNALTAVYRRYGLPWRMTMDNGSPWGNPGLLPYTAFTLWLIRLGIRVSHSRPYHPQTQGKDERFHRTLKAELLAREPLLDAGQAQSCFDTWRQVYNQERPHEALDMQTPARRYRVSSRTFPERLPSIEYPAGEVVRRVQGKGEISFKGQLFDLCQPLHGHPVALRPTSTDGLWQVFFCHQHIADIDQRSLSTLKPVPQPFIP